MVRMRYRAPKAGALLGERFDSPWGALRHLRPKDLSLFPTSFFRPHSIDAGCEWL